jgi:hypothetical protein
MVGGRSPPHLKSGVRHSTSSPGLAAFRPSTVSAGSTRAAAQPCEAQHTAAQLPPAGPWEPVGMGACSTRPRPAWWRQCPAPCWLGSIFLLCPAPSPSLPWPPLPLPCCPPPPWRTQQNTTLSGLACKVAGPAVWQVVSVHAGQHDVTHIPAGHRRGRVGGLLRVGRRGRARRVDGAETAAARAGVAQQHDGGCACAGGGAGAGGGGGIMHAMLPGSTRHVGAASAACG